MRTRAEPQFQEKTWCISVVLNKSSERLSVEREIICCKGRYRLRKNGQEHAGRGNVGLAGICAAWSMHFEEDCARPRSCPDGPSFNAPNTQTCSAKAVNGHPSRVADVRIGWDGFSTAPTGSNGRASAKTVRRVHDVPATQTAPRQAKTSREAGEGIAICERA